MCVCCEGQAIVSPGFWQVLQKTVSFCTNGNVPEILTQAQRRQMKYYTFLYSQWLITFGRYTVQTNS